MQNLQRLKEPVVLESPRDMPPGELVEPEFMDEDVSQGDLLDTYEMQWEIGHGASGSVVLAKDKRTHQLVAIKWINKLSLDAVQLKRIRREYNIMKRIDHKNWVKLLRVVETPEKIGLVMEYAAAGDLYTYIISRPNNRLSEKEARVIFVQLAEGLHYLHQKGFVHRDIKPENILLKRNHEALLADLGYGTPWDPNYYTSTPCGSLFYASPEIVSPDGIYKGPEVDVWSLGCVLYVMICGRLPFHGRTNDDTRALIMQGDFNMPVTASSEVKNLLSCMLDIDPKKRFTMDGVLKHRWVMREKQEDKVSEVELAKKVRRRSLSSSLQTLTKLRVWSSGGKSAKNSGKEPDAVDEEPQQQQHASRNQSDDEDDAHVQELAEIKEETPSGGVSAEPADAAEGSPPAVPTRRTKRTRSSSGGRRDREKKEKKGSGSADEKKASRKKRASGEFKVPHGKRESSSGAAYKKKRKGSKILGVPPALEIIDEGEAIAPHALNNHHNDDGRHHPHHQPHDEVQVVVNPNDNKAAKGKETAECDERQARETHATEKKAATKDDSTRRRKLRSRRNSFIAF